MGLFDFFKRKKETPKPAPAEVKEEVPQEVQEQTKEAAANAKSNEDIPETISFEIMGQKFTFNTKVEITEEDRKRFEEHDKRIAYLKERNRLKNKRLDVYFTLMRYADWEKIDGSYSSLAEFEELLNTALKRMKRLAKDKDFQKALEFGIEGYNATIDLPPLTDEQLDFVQHPERYNVNDMMREKWRDFLLGWCEPDDNYLSHFKRRDTIIRHRQETIDYIDEILLPKAKKLKLDDAKTALLEYKNKCLEIINSLEQEAPKK